jgi:hypothetical protein
MVTMISNVPLERRCARPHQTTPLSREVIAATGESPTGDCARAGSVWWLLFLERHWLPTLFALIAIGTVRVTLTYTVFSPTVDEPAHIATGMEWLDKKSYRLEDQHPPLARVMTALGPYLAGVRGHGNPDLYSEGLAILDTIDRPDWTLTLARMGILPFFWVACVVVFAWGRRYFGPTVGLMAVFLFTQLPGILAHSGLATTDMALTAFLGASVYTTQCWLEEPTRRRALVAGACIGLAVLSKFSALLFLPAALLAMGVTYALWERPSGNALLSFCRSRLQFLPIGLAMALLVVWAGYRFSIGEVGGVDHRLPAPELYSGISSVMLHNRAGHDSYLLGQRSRFGWWYFFPVALSVKTPLPLLFLGGAGLVNAARQRTAVRWALACSLGILLSAMSSHINLGTRHVLAVYFGLALSAAVYAVDRLRHWHARPWTGCVVIGLLGWLSASTALSHPDYLAYFNALAGDRPERILVESDLDWGQDAKRLAMRLREEGAREVAVLPRLMPDRHQWDRYLTHLGFPAVRDLDGIAPSPGWNAVFLSTLKIHPDWLAPVGTAPPQLWPEAIEPRERVGKGVLLYYFPSAKGG